MASSSFVLEFIANPTVVENIKRPRPFFKIIPKIAKMDDSIGAFSKIPKGVAFAKDPRAYIPYNIEDLGSENIKNMFMNVITNKQGVIKPKHKIVEDLGFVDILHMPEFEDETVRYVLSRVHGEFLWLDSVYNITKEAIRVVIGLPSIGTRPEKKKIPNKEVMNLSGATSDNRSLKVSDITDNNVKYYSMVIGYKVAHTNRLNYVSSLCIHSANEMVKNNAKIDICEWLKDELIENLDKIKGDKKGTFRFGNLIVCLMLYFSKEIPGIGQRDFAYDISARKHIKEAITDMGSEGDKKVKDYFKKFQAKMRQRERIPQNIVDKYDKHICFVIKRDEIWMEAVKPRTVWVTEMGYEVDSNILESYAKILLDAPPEPSEKIFGTAETIEKDVDIQKQRKKRDKILKDASKFVEVVTKGLLKLDPMSGVVAKKIKSKQQSVTHVSLVVTSSDSDSDKAKKFKRVDRKKRKSSPTPAPSPKSKRTLRNKEQAMRELSGLKKKVTQKKQEQQVFDTLSLEELVNEITQDENLSNVSKFYHSFKDLDKDTIEESIILYLDIYKKVLIEFIDVLPNDSYLRLEAKRMSTMELDKKLKVEALLVVHLVKFRQEIDELIAEANKTVFASGHRQVSLMADRIKEIIDETTDKWDIFFVEKEKIEEK